MVTPVLVQALSLFFFKSILKILFIWLHRILVVACGLKFPDQRLNSDTLHWELRVLATVTPGKFLVCTLLISFNDNSHFLCRSLTLFLDLLLDIR